MQGAVPAGRACVRTLSRPRSSRVQRNSGSSLAEASVLDSVPNPPPSPSGCPELRGMRGQLSHFSFLSLPFPVAAQGPRRDPRHCAGRWAVGQVSGGSPLRPVDSWSRTVSDPITEPERPGAGPWLPGAALKAISNGLKDAGDLGAQERGRAHPTWSVRDFHAPLRRVGGGFAPAPVVPGVASGRCLVSLTAQCRRGRTGSGGAGGLGWLRAPGGEGVPSPHRPRGCRDAHVSKRRRQGSWKNQWFGECVCTCFSYGSYKLSRRLGSFHEGESGEHVAMACGPSLPHARLYFLSEANCLFLVSLGRMP